MAMDFTVIQAVRQRFGDATDVFEIEEEQEAPFVGKSKDFSFSCPNIDPRELAVLQFETLGVTAGMRQGLPRNILRINGTDVPGGITPGAQVDVDQPPPIGGWLPFWKAHLLTVAPNVLREQNILHIESVDIQQGPGRGLDNFIVDNIVILFKTQPSGHGLGGLGVTPI